MTGTKPGRGGLTDKQRSARKYRVKAFFDQAFAQTGTTQTELAKAMAGRPGWDRFKANRIVNGKPVKLDTVDAAAICDFLGIRVEDLLEAWSGSPIESKGPPLAKIQMVCDSECRVKGKPKNVSYVVPADLAPGATLIQWETPGSLWDGWVALAVPTNAKPDLFSGRLCMVETYQGVLLGKLTPSDNPRQWVVRSVDDQHASRPRLVIRVSPIKWLRAP